MTSYEITKHFPNKNHFGTRSSRLDISLRSLLIRATSREISSKRISAFPKRLERVNRAEGNGGRLSRPISRDKSTGSHCQVHGVSDRPIPIARTFYATDGACVFFSLPFFVSRAISIGMDWSAGEGKTRASWVIRDDARLCSTSSSPSLPRLSPRVVDEPDRAASIGARRKFIQIRHKLLSPSINGACNYHELHYHIVSAVSSFSAASSAREKTSVLRWTKWLLSFPKRICASVDRITARSVTIRSITTNANRTTRGTK